MKHYEFSNAFFDRFAYKQHQAQHVEHHMFSAMSKALLAVLIDQAQKDGTCSLAASYLGKIVGAKRGQVRNRLISFARYGIITVEWRRRESGFDETNLIRVNPVLLGIFKDRGSNKMIDQFVDHYLAIGIRRESCDSQDLQGFFCDCVYGDPEPEDGKFESWQSKVIGMMNIKDDREKQKRIDAMHWKAISDEFVRKCADIWKMAQGEFGRGYIDPIWAEESSRLGTAARRERQELVKLFECRGGEEVAIAWLVFAAGVEQVDDSGKRIYDPSIPHLQFTTVDKKPSQFAKHYNAIIGHSMFKRILGKSTPSFESRYNGLKERFGDCFHQKPRVKL